MKRLHLHAVVATASSIDNMTRSVDKHHKELYGSDAYANDFVSFRSSWMPIWQPEAHGPAIVPEELQEQLWHSTRVQVQGVVRQRPTCSRCHQIRE